MTPVTYSAPLQTERLTLRLMEERDVDDIHSYQGRADVCRYLLFEQRTRDQVADKVAEHSRAVELAKDGDYWQLAMESPAAERVIGDIYFTVKSAENSSGEIGWTLHPDFQRRGFASEGASAVLDLAFRDLGLHRVIAELDPRNDASIALCRKLGMREEAYFVKDLMFRGEWADTGIYAILADEWAGRRSP